MINTKDFYLLRTPLLPLNFLDQFNGLSHEALPEKLKVIFAESSLQEAIYIASPELFSEFRKWMSGALTDEKEIDKLVLSLFRYLLRMSTRCTPYGLFAGMCVRAGRGGDEYTVIRSRHIQETLPDRYELCRGANLYDNTYTGNTILSSVFSQ